MHYAAFGSVVLGVGIALYLLKKYGRALNIMFLIAGGGLAPVLSQWVRPALASVGGMLFGVAAGALLAALALTWVIIEFKEKRTHKKTPWIALLLPTLMLASGLPIFLKVTNMVDQVGQQGNQAVTQTK